MHLVRDLLDKTIVDRLGQPMGRVDDVVIRVSSAAPPEIVGLEVGPIALATRIHRRVGTWAAALERAMTLPRQRPVRIPVGQIAHVAEHVHVGFDEAKTAAGAVEVRLRRRLGAASPGETGTAYAAPPLGADEYRVSALLSRTVYGDGREMIGRLEELFVDAIPGPAQITAVALGAAGLAERLGLTARLLIRPNPPNRPILLWSELAFGPTLRCVSSRER